MNTTLRGQLSGSSVGSDDLFSHSAAYLRGVSDCMIGKGAFACPFDFGSIAFSEWNLGHAAAVVRGFLSENA